jgi:hypothetical protein
MAIEIDEVALSDGTLVRHRVSGYFGRIDGVTGIQSCFTNRGAPMPTATNKEKFQYRVIVKGEKLRRIAPVRDLEVLDAGTSIHVTCFNCQTTFASSPIAVDTPGGICECGGWICPECLLCQMPVENSADQSTETCPNQRKRLLKKATSHKRAKGAVGSKTIAEPHAPKFRN